MSLWSLGSDISGSIRVPAHFCGVFGHKPTSDLVPQRGHAPPRSLPLQTDLTSGLGVCGPMARTAADLALALDILAGPDENQAGAYRLSLPPARHADLRSYRVLVIDDHPLLPVASDIRTALDQLAGRLIAAGAPVARSSALLPDLAEQARLHTKLVRNVVNFGRPPEYFQKMREGAAALARDDDSLKAWRYAGAASDASRMDDGRNRARAVASAMEHAVQAIRRRTLPASRGGRVPA